MDNIQSRMGVEQIAKELLEEENQVFQKYQKVLRREE
jgi:hypothetical protein